MSLHKVTTSGDSSTGLRNLIRMRPVNVVPRGFLGEVAVVAVAVVALTINMKLMSWLSQDPSKK